MDTFDKTTRSRVMRAIRSKNTMPELLVRRALHAEGFRFRLHSAALPGRPDIVLPKYDVAVLVHGCFWHHHHNCPYAYIPASNRDYWVEKLTGNVARDRANELKLKLLGWQTFTIWECQVDKGTVELIKLLCGMRGG